MFKRTQPNFTRQAYEGVILHDFHDPSYDAHVAEAHDFVTSQLGLSATSTDQIAIFGERQLASLPPHISQKYDGLGPGKAGYHFANNEVFFNGDFFEGAPHSQTSLVAGIVHELTHSGTSAPNQHMFFKEALAGMGEHAYLNRARTTRSLPLPTAMSLWPDDPELAINVPGSYLYTNDPNAPVHASHGLTSALAFDFASNVSGIGRDDIFPYSRPGSQYQYDLMKQSLDIVRPGLAKEVTDYPETSTGITKAAVMVIKAAKQQF